MVACIRWMYDFDLVFYSLTLTLKMMKSEPSATAHPFNASTQEARHAKSELEASLVYTRVPDYSGL